jgi:aldehyde dehydrogenase (NAD+)
MIHTLPTPSTQTSQAKSIVQKQRNFFATNQTKPIKFRLEQLKKLKAAIETNREQIVEAIAQDLHRDEHNAFLLEIAVSLNALDETIANLQDWATPVTVNTPVFYQKATSRILYEPFGNTLIIAPWNYPFLLAIDPLIGALAAGNTAVVKPSELAPATSAAIIHLLNTTFDPQYVLAVGGGVPETTELLNEKWDYIFFTGGTEIGRIVYQAAAKHLTPVTLELGGKSPCIVDSRTNLEYTAKRILWGKLVNAGQTCIAPDYLLVHTSLQQPLLEQFKTLIHEWYGPNPINSPEYCRIINNRHFDRLVKLIDPAKIALGGNHNAQERYIAPTILHNIDPDQDAIMQEEIFGPILPIIPFDEIDEAIAFVKKRPKPLALYMFSHSQRNIDRVLNETSSGGVCINDTIMQLGNAALPFGGVGDSGIGAYHGEHSFHTFSHRKAVMHRTLLFDVAVRYPSYQKTGKLLGWAFRKFGN